MKNSWRWAVTCAVLSMSLAISVGLYHNNELRQKQFVDLFPNVNIENTEKFSVQISNPREVRQIPIESPEYDKIKSIMNASEYKKVYGGYSTTNEMPVFRLFYEFSSGERYEVVLLQEWMMVNYIPSREVDKYTYDGFVDASPYQLLANMFLASG